MLIDFSTLSETRKYKIMSNTIFPRPIAWISTEEGGVVNLAPFSYFAPISSEPPCVVVSIAKKEDGEPKDTLRNILSRKVCTINFAHKELLDDLKNSAEELPPEVSECDEYGIRTKTVIDGFPPMVEDARCALFCEFVQKVELNNRYAPLILEIKHVYLDDDAVDERLNVNLQNIGRVGMEFLVDCVRVP